MRDVAKTVLKFLAWIAGIALVAGLILHFFFVDRVVVGHNAMAPTLFAGDEVLVWRGTTQEMGDAVLCEHPQQPGSFVIGRVYGKAGMTLTTERGQLYVEGTRPDVDIYPGTILFEDKVAQRTDEMNMGMVKLGNTEHLYFQRRDTPLTMRPAEVTRGLFLLGDNRNDVGYDSRAFGEVDPASCRGTVFMRLFPSDDTPSELDNGRLDIIK